MAKAKLEDPNIQRKTQRLYVTAYSCNAGAHREIEQLFKGKPFYLYEYFALAPYVIDKGCSGPWIAPFLAKVVARQQIIPDRTSVEKVVEKAVNSFAIGEVEYVQKTLEQVEKYVRHPAKILNVYKSTRIGALVLAHAGDLKAINATKGHAPNDVVRGSISVSPEKQSPVCRAIAGSIPFSELCGGQYLSKMKLSKRDKLGNFLEYLVAVHPWVSSIPQKVTDNPEQQLYYVSVAIASDRICFGYLLFFHWDPKVHAAVTAILNRSLPPTDNFDGRICAQMLLQTIARYARTVYMPVLALFENQWHEEIFLERRWSPQLWDSVCFVKAKDGEKDLIVKSLTELWKRRRDCWNAVAVRSKTITKDLRARVHKRITETLIFPRFTVASPQMVGVIEKILRSKTQDIGNNSVLTALVVGGPGTGKDALAKMIPLFCENYRFAPIVAVNMAQLRPNQLVPLLTMGFQKHVKLGGRGRGSSLEIEGLIQEFARKVNHAFDGLPSKFKKLGNKPERTIRGVLVLDELNSTDIDAQGALLRLLENTDLSGIGEISIDGEKRKTTGPLFIVGIINETPRLLTREETLRSLLTPGGLLGGPIGEAIYELFRKMRRLRDDLYYRIRRGCEVEIPALAMRREDIPILFFDQLDKMHPGIVIPPSTFDALLRPDISWPGNIRQLQSLCNRVAGYIETSELVHPEQVEKAMREEKLIS